MTDTKMLQAILDSQVSIKNELKDLKEEVHSGFEEVNDRIDKLGESLAYLEDDAPTREEHDELEKRVTKIEKKLIASA